ncbi:hypothetical protein [Sandaracinobacteroides saxicola]|uniref:Uncharacterized protein n=1 Tax=Sandaracinobacteroides saxicola TaxID=2759707 RepID=A0A7G5IK81_9SPHN|nr:hypothetical protein [Sandaracinobacteroides saxicola]QMW23773.1 hypothetical protein H3309_04635 [Sandaracinobacteroides saxicola]
MAEQASTLKIIWGFILIGIGWKDIHADEIERSYSQVIRAYGLALRTRLVGSPPAAGAEAMAAEIDDAITSAEGDGSTSDAFSRLMQVELAYFRASDPANKLASAQATRERFARVAAPGAVTARESTQPVALSLTWTDEMTADTIGLMNYIHAQYMMNMAREMAVTRQKTALILRVRRVLAALFAAFVVTALVRLGFGFAGHTDLGDTILKLGGVLSVIFALGYLGSIVSVTQRFQKAVDSNVMGTDPVFTIGGLLTGQRGIDVAMLSAGVFALLLYVLFASGMASALGLSGGVFPAVDNCPALAATTQMGDIGRLMGFCGSADLLRMFIFAFLAGFSERLVPDVINRIADRTAVSEK